MQSMDEIYREHAKTVYRYLLSLTRDPGLAEELTQETFYQAIRTVDRFDQSCRITTWLCSIAKNVLLTYRRKHPACEDFYETDRTGESAESEALGRMGHLELLKKLHSMEEPYKEVMYLRIFGDLSFAQIGEVVGKNENWARVTFYRGKEKLGKEVQKNE
ncbi:MAG: sigma-70 family RNA polymerase sigma factor [Lachnospiraceae bacterium]|nr:sigma-70 family RNA polymerase sigma factor [Lachnospiraceae bacterium]